MQLLLSDTSIDVDGAQNWAQSNAGRFRSCGALRFWSVRHQSRRNGALAHVELSSAGPELGCLLPRLFTGLPRHDRGGNLRMGTEPCRPMGFETRVTGVKGGMNGVRRHSSFAKL